MLVNGWHPKVPIESFVSRFFTSESLTLRKTFYGLFYWTFLYLQKVTKMHSKRIQISLEQSLFFYIYVLI